MHFPNSLPSILVSSQKKDILRSSFVRHPVQLIRGIHFCFTSTSPSTRMERIHFLGCFALFQSSFSIHYHYSILRSSFFLLLFSESQKRTPYPTPTLPPPPMSDCVFTHACVRAVGVMVWYGSRQSGSTDCSPFFPSPVLYYLHITGDSVY
jgi:hypothetical protein